VGLERRKGVIEHQGLSTKKKKKRIQMSLVFARKKKKRVSAVFGTEGRKLGWIPESGNGFRPKRPFSGLEKKRKKREEYKGYWPKRERKKKHERDASDRGGGDGCSAEGFASKGERRERRAIADIHRTQKKKSLRETQHGGGEKKEGGPKH